MAALKGLTVCISLVKEQVSHLLMMQLMQCSASSVGGAVD